MSGRHQNQQKFYHIKYNEKKIWQERQQYYTKPTFNLKIVMGITAVKIEESRVIKATPLYAGPILGPKLIAGILKCWKRKVHYKFCSFHIASTTVWWHFLRMTHGENYSLHVKF